jgi:hypothetical protein
MASSKYRIRIEEIGKHVERIFEIDDCELLLLKAHLLIERILVAAAAARLRENDHEAVPKMSFSTLIDLATDEDDKRRPLIWFNELRNSLAHEFDALDGEEFRRRAERFEVRWPRGFRARLTVLRAIVNYVMLLAWETYLDHSTNQFTLERSPQLSDEAKPFLEKAVAIIDGIRRAKEFLNSVRDLPDELATGALLLMPPPPPQD